MKLFSSFLTLLLLYQSECSQVYPGTPTRPILSSDEAAKYTEENYFADWSPEDIVTPDLPDYTVQEGQSIQEVVNEAVKNGDGSSRVYIKIEAGHYMETVYIKSSTPLTIYGDVNNPENVHIMATLSATTSASDYQSIVNPNGTRYQEGDPAWSFYSACAAKSGIIGSGCTAVFYIESDHLQLLGVTVHNGAVDAQAIAVRTEADKLHLMNNNFMGMQDTLALGFDNDGGQLQRVMVHMCYIEGEIDYVCGNAQAVFKMATFYTVTNVETEGLYVFAPDTPAGRSYGFLVIQANVTGDGSYVGSGKVKLARSWDQGISNPEDYIPDQSPNGQLVIRDSFIDGVINVEAPYGSAATSGRSFSTDVSTDRDLDDNSHNRLWEFNNYGDGA